MGAIPKGVKKVAILAGAGQLPRHVYDACLDQKVEPYLVGIEGETSKDNFKGIKYDSFQIHNISKIVKAIKKEGITHVSLAGKVQRADISKLLLDLKGAKLFTMIIRNGINDNAILTTILEFIESEGFSIISPESIAQDIIIKKGDITRKKPNKTAEDDIKKGLKVLKGVATFDVGQSLVIQNGLVLGVEAAEGTDELIKRCGTIKQEGEGPILIKISKPEQDKRVDLPCIGPTSIENAHKYGIRGIAIESGSAMIIEPKKTIDMANKLGVFIRGI